ncbi:MAG: MetQ/NlpA family lipoprotein [Gammaproteobacteria bacterium]|nr:MetQ/NlpA family lipoprotein [Gammaproteobacteria bacterium]MCW5583251.1 MetQ/NlpA family lipoprotein [Gammaproteobacteria bacterium]
MSAEILISLLKASWETIYMVFIASFMSVILGLCLGSFLYLTGHRQALENKLLHRFMSIWVNITRSMPFIILMIMLIPFTRLLMGTTIGTNAALVPLTIAAIPFYARVCESALSEVPYGLIEVGNAMGASTWHMVTKILIPESLPSLIRGATLMVIGLIGYSAMAGVVGGGGLGELAINYGYQRFDVVVMTATVVMLVMMVQVVQMLGDKLANRCSLRWILPISALLWIACITYQVWPSAFSVENTLRVGVISGQAEKVMKVAEQVAKDKYGLYLKVVTFSDYVQPNTALDNHSIDANIFQHEPYLQGQSKAHHYHLAAIAKTFVYPMGFYSQKINDISQLKNKSIIAIPNDPSNEGRSLLLLEKAGLIKLKSDVGTYATISDIIVNKQQLQFKLLDAAQLPRVLKDVALAAITNDFLAPTGLTIQQSMIKEGSDSPYANLIVARKEDKDNPLLQKLVEIMHSQPVINETQKCYPDGAAVPAWKDNKL